MLASRRRARWWSRSEPVMCASCSQLSFFFAAAADPLPLHRHSGPADERIGRMLAVAGRHDMQLVIECMEDLLLDWLDQVSILMRVR